MGCRSLKDREKKQLSLRFNIDYRLEGETYGRQITRISSLSYCRREQTVMRKASLQQLEGAIGS